MARHKAISREEILLHAYRSWTTNGYHGTGLRQLAGEIGFTIASLLHRFHSKEELMAQVIAQSREAWNQAISKLNSQDIPWERRWEDLKRQLLKPEPEGGLLLAILAAELPSLPPLLQGLAREYHGTILGWLVRMLGEAKRRQDWSGGDPSLAAQSYLQQALGEILLLRLK